MPADAWQINWPGLDQPGGGKITVNGRDETVYFTDRCCAPRSLRASH